MGSLRLSGYELGVVSSRFAVLPYTWVPLWPGYLTQHLFGHGKVGDEANFYIGVAADVERPFGWGGRVRAEVLVDDMPQNPEDPIIYQVGGTLVAEANGGWSVRYARVNNYVGTFQVPALSLVHAGRLLAFPAGPDGESLRVAWRRPEERMDSSQESLLAVAGVSVEWRRRGPGRIGDMWEREGFEQAKQKQFLGGTVEHALLLGVDLQSRNGATLTLTAGPIWNAANQPGAHATFVGIGFIAR